MFIYLNQLIPGIPGRLKDHLADGGEDPLEDLDDGGDHEEEDDGAQAPLDEALGVHAESRVASLHPAHATGACAFDYNLISEADSSDEKNRMEVERVQDASDSEV